MKSPLPYALATQTYLSTKYPYHKYDFQIVPLFFAAKHQQHVHVEVVQCGRWHIPDKRIVRVNCAYALGNWRVLTAVSFNHAMISKEELDRALAEIRD